MRSYRKKNTHTHKERKNHATAGRKKRKKNHKNCFPFRCNNPLARKRKKIGGHMSNPLILADFSFLRLATLPETISERVDYRYDQPDRGKNSPSIG